jgi:uncharacterized membrane protein YbjE (DUF340 family)
MYSVEILIRLFIGHLLGDFFLQPKTWIDERINKHYRSTKLYLHSFIHALLSGLMLWENFKWQIPVSIFITHLLIDLFKSYKARNKTVWFLIDQALHILVILILWVILFEKDWLAFLTYLLDTKVLTVIIAFIFLTKPVSVFVGIATDIWKNEISNNKKEELKNAGMWIGIIERILILVFILSSIYGGIGFLLAAKSIFRFGDLRIPQEKNQTEYFLIGTLLSFAIAIIVGLITRQILFT